MNTSHPHRLAWRIFWIVVLVLLGFAGAAFAQDATDPPGRVAYVSYRQGSVVFAPQGEEEWVELPANRPLTTGDRVWTDRGARAELQLGAATVHVDGESHLGVSDLDERSAQFILQQGSVNVRVRELVQGENVEIDTPNLAFRATQPGDYRIDVDPAAGETRVTVQSGMGSVFGEGGESIQMGAGQQANFAGRSLAQVQGPGLRLDDFGLWAAERNRLEDQSIAARHVPRGVVGYAQLDQYGTWGQDPAYGTVWYPTVTIANWAPYRYGHWEWISPWGWTWVDDAPWGFAPFHYGRWAMIGSRWCWVPGRLATRPLYSPALVVFLGGGGTRVSFSSGPAVGWYPLAPGEAWWPVYRTSPRYVNYANVNINLNAYPRHYQNHFWRTRPTAVTAVAEDDFRRGRPVYRQWQPLSPQVIGSAQTNVVPVRPELRHRGEFLRHEGPRLHGAPPPTVQQAVPQPATAQPAGPQRFWGGEAPAVREQRRAQRDAERAAREQQRGAEQEIRWQDLRVQREQQLRQQQDQAARIQSQREAVVRQQQEQAARAQAQREETQRGIQVEQLMQRRQQERAQAAQRAQQEREQAVQRMQQERQREAVRQQQQQREQVDWQRLQQLRAQQQQQVQAPPPQVRVPQQQVQPVQQPPRVQQVQPAQQAAPAGGRGQGGERRWQQRQADDQPGQGQGQGHGRGHWQR